MLSKNLSPKLRIHRQNLRMRPSSLPVATTLRAGSRWLDLRQPIVMGILNVTPDSFFAGSRTTDPVAVVNRARTMVAEGATILDVGGYSTRPGADDVPPAEEAARVVPAVAAVRQALPDVMLSVDTFRASVARAAVAAGANLVNDVSGGQLDAQMWETVADLQVPYVLMHSRGNPRTMQQMTTYGALMTEMVDFFQKRLYILSKMGIYDVVVDPGIGFAKNRAQNFELVRGLSAFRVLGRPLMLGISRKSFVYRTLGLSPEEALNGTTAMHAMALGQGAHILRVHDVRPAVQTVELFKCLGFDAGF